MSRHRRPGPPNQSSRAIPRIDPAAPLAAYEKRRRAPLDGPRRHRPLHGGARHLDPQAVRVLEEWNGFAYESVGTAPDLRSAQVWAAEPHADRVAEDE
ncbi:MULTISPECIES: DUF6087 family protein [unclassified Streptomyces]|uniref:DUF6087 family protein n=1 Tax=unclassified Streptomyces TaxID=2593676 RepID=UPI00101C2C0D|nr:DUF6087 family protein [Streptomyces sp. L-9-10]